jgi:hypothetical protein
MAAVVIVRRHQNSSAPLSMNGEQGPEIFIENLPPKEVHEVDAMLGTLLLGL